MSGFVAAAGTDFSYGQEPTIAARLDQLAKRLGVTIYGISGHRSPGHSVQVGGSANDPHTRGQAADIGVGSMLRSSAGRLTAAQLKSVGLTRPFGGAEEINHVQLLPGTEGFKGTVNVTPLTPAPLRGLVTDPLGAAGDAAQAPFRWAVGQLSDTLSADGPKLLLYVALILGGGILALYGIARATGLDKKAAAAAGVTPAGRAARTAGAAL